MSEVAIRYNAVVAIPESFNIEVPEEGKEGSPWVVGQVMVAEGADAGLLIDFRGSLSEKETSIGGTVAEITMKQLRALGWRCNDLTALEGLGSVKAQATGKWNVYDIKKDGKPTGKKGKKLQYSFWPANAKQTLRAEDMAAFAARFTQYAAGLQSEVVTVNDRNAAPEVMPSAKSATATAAPTADGAPAGSNGAPSTALFG